MIVTGLTISRSTRERARHSGDDMGNSNDMANESPATACRPRRRRWGAALALAALAAGGAALAPQILGSASATEKAELAGPTCTLWASVEATSPISSGDPAQFTGTMLDGTAQCEDPQGQILAAKYSSPGEITGRANCETLEVSDIEFRVQWRMANGSTEHSTIKVGTFAFDTERGLVIENATVTGGPEAVAGKSMSASADTQVIDAMTATVRDQCENGTLRDLGGNINVQFS